MTTPTPLRPALQILFDALFWTPFWLVPLVLEHNPTAAAAAEDVVTGIAMSAFLGAITHLFGRRRPYAYLVLGLLAWAGAAGFAAYAILGAGQINAYGLADASNYAGAGLRTWNYVSGYGWVALWLAVLSLPFAGLALLWRRLAGPVNRLYAVGLAAIFLVPVPAKFVKCSRQVCDKIWLNQLDTLYPYKHFRPVDSYMALADVAKLSLLTPPPPRPAPKVAILNKTPLTLVVMVGETFNRNHFGLYGYCRPTTPHLMAMKDQLYVFRDLASLKPFTFSAVPASLELQRMRDQSRDDRLMSVLNQGGFDTDWISNQANVTNPPNAVVRVAETAHHHVWLNAFEALTAVDPPDSDLLPQLSQALAAPAPRKAIFLHMMGAHIQYVDRVPPQAQMALLPPPSGSRSAAALVSINQYDDAIRYDDGIFDAVIAAVARKGGDAAVVIYGDHGEENSDQLPISGHGFPATRGMVEAPLIIWLSPSLRAHRPYLAAALARATGERLQIPDIPAMIVDLAGLAVQGLPSSLRPLSADFHQDRRLVEKHDYDSDPNLGVTPLLPPLCAPAL